MRFIPSEDLKLGTVVGRDIIFTAQKTAMLKKGTVLNERYIEYLQEKGYMGAYVTDEVSADIEVGETVDQYLFQDCVEAVMEENISSMLDISAELVADITSKKEICADLIDLRSFDDYTYHHSVNVAVLSVLVARQMGLSEDELNMICQAGLLHDIGKSKIKLEILNKPDKLTDDEFQTMKKHPQYSYDIISESREISSMVKQAVLCHHENENGSGYPNGKEGSEVSVLARIIHVVDVYDALISKRPYKEPYEPANVLGYLKEGIGKQYNKDVVNAIIEVIPPYPTGIDVILSDNRRAVVFDHSKSKMRPIVRLIDTKENIDLSDPKYSDIKILKLALIPDDETQGQIHTATDKIEDLNEHRSAVKLVKKRVIAIDPNLRSITQLQSVLEYESYFDSFSSGFEAIKAIEEGQLNMPDLIITETAMPIMDGFVTVKKIREICKKPIPVIFFTADNSANTIYNAKSLTNTDYILKPGNPLYIKERAYTALYNIDT